MALAALCLLEVSLAAFNAMMLTLCHVVLLFGCFYCKKETAETVSDLSRYLFPEKGGTR